MASARDPKTSAPPGKPRVPVGPNAAAEHAERLKTLIREAATPEDALEPALRQIVESAGGAGGAICFFDQRKEVLRLAAECNLSDEGCRRLRSVRRGDVAGWDMPLHGLLNRRAYLIDSAAKNRYVPPLVDPPNLVRSIVCLPIYQGNTALGSLLIVTTGARMLAERDIRMLEPSLRELAMLIEAIRLRAPTLLPSARPAATVPVAGAATAADAACGDVAELRARLEDLEARATTERAEVAALRDRAADAESAAEEERARSTDLAAKLAEATAAAEEARAQTADLTARLGEATAAVAAAAARERALEARLAEARPAVPADLPARVAQFEAHAEEQLRRATDLEAQIREQTAHIAELKSRAEAAEEAQQYVKAEIVATQSVVEMLRKQLAERQEQIERLEPAAHAANSLDRDLRATREREMQLRTRLAALEAMLGGQPVPAAVPPAPQPVAPAPTPAPAAAESEQAAVVVAPPAEPTDAPAAVVVIDTGTAWSRLDARAGVRVMTPDQPLEQRLATGKGRVLVNLVAPGTLHALARVRAAGSSRRFWGCLAAPDAARALPLGMIEPAVRPLAPETLVELLGAYATKGTRVVTLGREIDAFGGFRQSMARQGLSVSMAWDAKQAADVIGMVRPEVAIIDLESLREGCAIMAGLAGADPLPHFILLFGAKDPSPGFAHAVRDPAHASRAVPLDRLIADLRRRSEDRPVERR